MSSSRRWFLVTLPALLGGQSGKGRVFPSDIYRYADPATEFPVVRLTDPKYTSNLPAYYGRAISRRDNFLIFSCDRTGSVQAFRLDLKSGQSKQLTEAVALDASSLTLHPDESSFYYLDGRSLRLRHIARLHDKEIYRIPDDYQASRGVGGALGVAEDGLNAVLAERLGELYRLRLINLRTGDATTIAEARDSMGDPIPRPKRAGVLYRRGGDALWLANFDGQQNYRLKLAPGKTGPALWSPDGRSVFYLSLPEDRKTLNGIRELTPDTNEEQLVAVTSQFVHFGRNADASVFVGSSGSKASPYLLLLVRTVRRELTISEHRASQPFLVAPVFSPNSQRVYFQSDRHGKSALYSMSVERLVEETEA